MVRAGAHHRAARRALPPANDAHTAHLRSPGRHGRPLSSQQARAKAEARVAAREETASRVSDATSIASMNYFDGFRGPRANTWSYETQDCRECGSAFGLEALCPLCFPSHPATPTPPGMPGARELEQTPPGPPGARELAPGNPPETPAFPVLDDVLDIHSVNVHLSPDSPGGLREQLEAALDREAADELRQEAAEVARLAQELHLTEHLAGQHWARP